MNLDQRYRKIYVASSWRNAKQQEVVISLRVAGHLVYDFRNPSFNIKGFSWSEIDPLWQQWTAETYKEALDHPLAKKGFACDMDAMKWADTFVLVLPCGRSAHLELGWACGMNKQTIIILEDKNEPELMNKMVDHLCLSLDEVIQVLDS